MANLVRHVMSPDVKTARPDMVATDAAGLMASYDIGAVPLVSEDGRLAGIVTDRDLVVRVLADRADPTQVTLDRVATSKRLSTISPDASVAAARTMMAEHKVKRLVVTKDDEVVGIVSLGDLAQASASDREIGETVAEIFETPASERLASSAGPDPGTPDRVREAREAREGTGP